MSIFHEVGLLPRLARREVVFRGFSNAELISKLMGGSTSIRGGTMWLASAAALLKWWEAVDIDYACLLCSPTVTPRWSRLRARRRLSSTQNSLSTWMRRSRTTTSFPWRTKRFPVSAVLHSAEVSSTRPFLGMYSVYSSFHLPQATRTRCRDVHALSFRECVIVHRHWWKHFYLFTHCSYLVHCFPSRENGIKTDTALCTGRVAKLWMHWFPIFISELSRFSASKLKNHFSSVRIRENFNAIKCTWGT